MGRNEWIACGLPAVFPGGAALAGPSGQSAWFISRASGIAAFLALSAPMILEAP